MRNFLFAGLLLILFGALPSRAQDVVREAREHFARTKQLAPHPVDDMLAAVDSGQLIVIEFPCPDGSTVRLEIEVRVAPWTPTPAGSHVSSDAQGRCEWEVVSSSGTNPKTVRLRATIRINPAAFRGGRVNDDVNAAEVWYHELLHAQLLVDAARATGTGAGGATVPGGWQATLCACRVDWGPADLRHQLGKVPRLSEIYRDRVFNWLGSASDPWNERTPTPAPEPPAPPSAPAPAASPPRATLPGSARPTPTPSPQTRRRPAAPTPSASPATRPRPAAPTAPPRSTPGRLRPKGKGTTTMPTPGGGWGTGYWHAFEVEAGSVPVHDVHVRRKRSGSPLLPGARPRGWTGKATADGQGVTYERGRNGQPIGSGELGKFSVRSLDGTVELDWTLTDERHDEIPDSSGTVRVALAPANGRAEVLVARVEPAAAPPGSIVTVHGSGFGRNGRRTELEIGGRSATLLEGSGDRLKALVPDGASGHGLTVRRGSKASATWPFEVEPQLKTGWMSLRPEESASTARLVVEVVGSEEPQRVRVVTPKSSIASFRGSVIEEREIAPDRPESFELLRHGPGVIEPIVQWLRRGGPPVISWDESTDVARLQDEGRVPILKAVDPRRPSPGEALVVEGANFGTVIGELDLRLGPVSLPILQAEPGRLVALIPEDARSGRLSLSKGPLESPTGGQLELSPTLGLSATRRVVRKGHETTLHVTVLGSDQPLDVELACTTPAIATFADGTTFARVTTSGGESNVASQTLDTHAPGQFDVRARLVDPRPRPELQLELQPSPVRLQAGQRLSLRVFVLAADGTRRELRPERVQADPSGLAVSPFGDLSARSAGRWPLLVEAEGLQAWTWVEVLD